MNPITNPNSMSSHLTRENTFPSTPKSPSDLLAMRFRKKMWKEYQISILRSMFVYVVLPVLLLFLLAFKSQVLSLNACCMLWPM
jgi:hypothetical protein